MALNSKILVCIFINWGNHFLVFCYAFFFNGACRWYHINWTLSQFIHLIDKHYCNCVHHESKVYHYLFLYFIYYRISFILTEFIQNFVSPYFFLLLVIENTSKSLYSNITRHSLFLLFCSLRHCWYFGDTILSNYFSLQVKDQYVLQPDFASIATLIMSRQKSLWTNIKDFNILEYPLDPLVYLSALNSM